MVSIVICSTTPQITEHLQINIEEKIGVPFEIIRIDNSNNTYSIFSAYNEGVAKSNFDTLCFMHEDVLVHTENWGTIIINHLKNTTTGIIGVCGCSTISRIPSPWSLFNHYKYFLQSTPTQRKKELQQIGVDPSTTEKEALAVDGVFMCARKSIFQNIHFDDNSFSGYHSYDIDICLQAYMAGYKNYFINDVLIEHFSKGHHNKGWIINSMTLCDKWYAHLPISLTPVSNELLIKTEYRYMTDNFVKYMIRAGYTNMECSKIVLKYLGHHPDSEQKKFIQRINLKVLLVRLTKKPLSFFPSLFKSAFVV